MGFFHLRDSNLSYLGIWYINSGEGLNINHPAWIANRDAPIHNSTGKNNPASGAFTLEWDHSDCKVRCWEDCNCFGFINNGDTGCTFYRGNTLKFHSSGNYPKVYVLPPANPSEKRKKLIMIIIIVVAVSSFLVLLSSLLYCRRRKKKRGTKGVAISAKCTT
ncbi:hypothetical protein POM88_028546 [Heracleum sosnowskyi]|uniref:Bulb-type lectin domain-containing protein n=1 Tax=Heracleum sosnowskyi TaxID=360622 RepID=A0AAD8HT26_9APIA|nr:hypothetical protein POM88_028546 [Heracleum sosnowskyi]